MKRPEGCEHCQKQAKVLYKEVVKGEVVCTQMCSSCPCLEERLQGYSDLTSDWEKKVCDTKLSCASCLTTLEDIKTGNPLGCSNCYAVFGDILIDEMLPGEEKKDSLHVGRLPDKAPDLSPTSRLNALHEALEQALERENYEEAASLRDRIKELTGQ